MMKIYGVSVSYYTGKLEAYFRYKGFEYSMSSPYADAKAIRGKVGALQVPIVERNDGRWMSDTTPMILGLENEHPAPTIMPSNAVVRFVAMLIEDYADEWLWRAAMHYRWSYEHDSALLSRILTDEIAQHIRVPRFIKLRMIKKRQYNSFVVKDGVTRETWSHVEAGYHNALSNLTSMLGDRPYLLGAAPSIADFGMMGPMLRHFGQDPTPAEIMRNEAPVVFAWLSRVWNASQDNTELNFVDTIPGDTMPMLKEIAETHLVQLAHNAEAYGRDQSHFDMMVQSCQYRRLPVSRYRVYCLERLRDEFSTLNIDDQSEVKALLPYSGAEILWVETFATKSGYDELRQAPFNKAINVYGHGTPS